uniref:Putative acetyltransferase n=1 Tax=viral metagenome TaxID=1070528 RepID=A0A6M3LC98_9ZZZZ
MIRLRPLEREDLRQLRDWRNDPEIFSRVREYRPLNMDNQEAWFDSLRDDRKTIMFGVEFEVSDDPNSWAFVKSGVTPFLLIGVCGLTNIDWTSHKAEVSIYIGDKDLRGKGLGVVILNLLAKYAFEECNLNRLWAEVFLNNEIGQKLFKSAGYQEEGRLRDHAFKGGEYWSSFIYGLLREEWQKKNAHVA